MKKIFLTLLILFSSIGLFADTGYAGIKWGTSKSKFKLIDEDENTKGNVKSICDNKTHIYYHFSKDVLYAVSYTTTVKNTTKIIKHFQNKIFESNFENYTKESWIEELMQENRLQEIDSSKIDLLSNKEMLKLSRTIEKEGLSFLDQENKGNTVFYIYNYNDDTRVYIYENIVEGLTFVVYTYHEQDY